MAKGSVKTWDGLIAKISSHDHEQLIIAESQEFNQGFEPSIGDELSFKIKKRKQNGEVILYAKKIQFMNANPYMLSGDELKKNAYKQLLVSILSTIILALAVAGLAYFGYNYYQQQQMKKQFIELSEKEILRDNS